MSRNGVRLAKVVTVSALVPMLLVAFRFGPPPRNTGAPGETTCWQLGCHLTSSGSFFPNSSSLSVDFGAGTYTPGGPRQQWRVSINDPAGVVFGFQMSARIAGSNAQAGHFSAVAGGDPVIVVPSGGIEYIEHTQPKQVGSFLFEWTPPATNLGDIRVYLSANAANNSFDPTGDRIHNASFTLAPAAASTRPAITPGQVANAWSEQPVVADAGWIYIKGSNLAPSTRTWRQDEIVGGQLPKSLDGVSVKVNNADAPVYYISPTQINVQVPSDGAAGPVPVQVTTPNGASDVVMVNKQPTAPALFMWPAGVATEANKYAGTVTSEPDPTGGSRTVYLGKPGLLGPVGLSTRPAKPGEVVLFFATGCGPTNPPTVAGQVVGSPAPTLASPVTMRIGGQPAALAGNTGFLIFAGECQFNATIPPNTPDGDQLVELEIGGFPAQGGLFITVQR